MASTGHFPREVLPLWAHGQAWRTSRQVRGRTERVKKHMVSLTGGIQTENYKCTKKKNKQTQTQTTVYWLQREGGGQERVKGANYLVTEETDGGWAHSAYAGDLSQSRTREAK